MGTDQDTEAVFEEKGGVWDTLLELTTTSPYLIVDECFPNYSKKEEPIGNLGKGAKGRVTERELLRGGS